MRSRHVVFIALSAFLLATAIPTAEAATRDPDASEVTPVPEAAARTLELVNRERASAGLTALTLDDEAARIAADWSPRMAADGALSHNRDYLSEASLRRLDATLLGENVAFAESLEEIHGLFMKSAPHRANILKADFRQIGIAAVRTASGSIYLTQDFLTRRAKEAAPARKQGSGAGASAKKASAKKASAKKASAGKAPAKRPARRPRNGPARRRG
jgi:uncharacterized protein YkwD